MPNNVFVGFPNGGTGSDYNVFVGFPNGGTGSDYRDADSVKELQPITTWTRDGNYQVTRRWRGSVTALESFSDGGVGNKDFAGTYFTGASGILPGGAGRDGAISTDLQNKHRPATR
jgi:hypothetical protein